MITLIIVDLQNDFISGTMSVKNAKNILLKIKDFITANKDNIDKIIFTADWHPYNHCSFKRNGGEWPQHCVQYTPGACIEPKLLKLVQSLDIPYEVSTKGDYHEREQYGAFEIIELVKDSSLGDRYYLDSLCVASADTDFIVCGIAGDYCVKETIKNLISGGIIPKVFLEGVASIDDGSILQSYLDKFKIKVI